MEIKEMIHQLIHLNVIDAKRFEYKPMSGGTSSKVGVLVSEGRPVYVVKTNAPEVIEPEVRFLQYYRDINKLPHVVFTDPHHRYFVYDYIPGGTSYRGSSKPELLRQLTEQVVSRYKPMPHEEGWGWPDDRSDSWQQFLQKEVLEASSRIASVLPQEDHRLVLELAGSPARSAFAEVPCLLHGDFGMHNVIASEDRLSGVIDPTPLLGPPLYDCIYAFCSSPDDLNKKTLAATVNLLVSKDYDEKLLCQEALIGLYLRIATCIKYHSYDLKAYLKAWSHWKEIVQ